MTPLRFLTRAASLLVLLLAADALALPTMSRDEIICRAKSGVGFSYWWGGGCWCASGCSPNFACAKGGCSGNCPSCNHWGGYGADCSGFTTKVWQVPNAISVSTCGHGPYVAATYTKSTSYWDKISRSSMQKGDALASSTHVLIYESGDPWGSFWAYECKGCSWGCVHNVRTAGSTYSAARRHNLGGGECSPGQVQSKGCGQCGSQARTCSGGGTWGGWSGCSGEGPCAPGAKQDKGCGNCGHQGRACTGSCQWGSWGSCDGQGPCAPGGAETEACGDCGAHSRSCGGDCSWAGWSACEGPDPDGGTLACDTGELGVCEDGRVRCVAGWKACVRLVEPSEELCDDRDNDCDGPSDEGQPTVMGDPAPEWAADTLDVSYPQALPPGGTGTAWVVVRNVGSAPWKKGVIWLGAMGAGPGEASPLAPMGQWPAWDVAAVADRDVAPGESVRLQFPVAVGKDATGVVSGHMAVLGPGGVGMRCPRPGVDIDVMVIPEALQPFAGALSSGEPHPVGGETAPATGGGAGSGKGSAEGGAASGEVGATSAPLRADGAEATGCGQRGAGPSTPLLLLFALLLTARWAFRTAGGSKGA